MQGKRYKTGRATEADSEDIAPRSERRQPVVGRASRIKAPIVRQPQTGSMQKLDALRSQTGQADGVQTGARAGSWAKPLGSSTPHAVPLVKPKTSQHVSGQQTTDSAPTPKQHKQVYRKNQQLSAHLPPIPKAGNAIAEVQHNSSAASGRTRAEGGRKRRKRA